MSVTLYGIKNCDTIKRARKYLEAESVDYTFHDYRVDGIDKTMVRGFVKALGWENVLNKRGTTWRQLDDQIKERTNETSVVELLCEHPAMIKRPILKQGKTLTLGFSTTTYDKLFK